MIALVASACGSSGSKSAGPRPTTGASAEPATQPISDAVPAGAKRLHLEVGPITVEPGQNNIAYTKERIPQPTEDGWIVGITPNIRKADGTVPPVDVIHLHRGVWLNMSAHDVTRQRLPERFFAVGEEKTRMILPKGYGYAYKTSDRWLFNYMIHNLKPKPDKVWVTYDIDFVPASSPAAQGIVPELSGPCGCRKPGPGMLLEVGAELGLDLASSWIIGAIHLSTIGPVVTGGMK